MPAALRVIRPHEVVPDPERWVLTEEQVPESSPHDLLSERIRDLLLGWAARAGRSVKIGRNLAIRWDPEHPQRGVDPDVYIVEPSPPDADELESLLLWEPGRVPPLLAVEIVSRNHPYKDYLEAPRKYAVCGVGELWILDPRLVGPRSAGGPHRIQIWRRLDSGDLTLLHAGEGPAWSEAVQGWVRTTPDGRSFDLTSDEAGDERWLTPEEAERAAKEAERAAKEAALRRAEAAERRVQELEALLARGR
jgi:Uma2 family endonuclease